MPANREPKSAWRLAAACARVILGLSLVPALLHATGCQSIAGIVDRRYEPAVGDGGQTAEDGGANKPPSPACTTYCNVVMDACKAPPVYSSKVTCLGVCALLEEGDLTAKDPTGNTVACRLNQAKQAQIAGQGDANCPAAGPGGASVCGDDCDSYCTLYGKICPENATDKCPEKCRAVLPDDIESFDALVKNHEGNTVQCRLVHTSNSTFDPTTHCSHAQLLPPPETFCTEPTPSCDEYCRVNMAACTGDNAVYGNLTECMAVCAALDPGTTADVAEDTRGCRIFHSYNSLNIGVSHCAHTGIGGDGHCGSGNCPPYCKLLAAQCPKEFGTFKDAAACEAACEAVPGAGKDGSLDTAKTGGDTVQCRLHHLSLAFVDKTGTECANALNGTACP
jgi:hypothetical protein